jgi:hypothetical protein
MLPDLPIVKRNVMTAINGYLAMRIRQKMGIFGEIPHQRLHEGDRNRIIRDDGSVEDSALKRSSAEDSIPVEEVPLMTSEDRLRRMELLAEEMAQQMSQHMHDSLGKTLDDHGQTINLQGQPLGPEAVLEMFDKIRMQFDEAGNPVGLSVVFAPEMAEQWASVQKQIEGDPALQQRFNDLFDRKRGEWRDREAARKLVG